MDHAERVVIVTGGGRGIGRAYALRFAAAGYRVAIADVDGGSAGKVRGEIEAAGGVALALATDVSDAAACERMAAATQAAFGRIDVLINNAALFAALVRKPLWEIDPAEWDRVLAVNLRGPWLAMRAVLPAMRAQGGGSIINISSNTFLTGRPGFAHYVASKGGIVGLTRAAARELGEHNIRVNCILPGRVETGAWSDDEPGRQAEVIRSQSLKRAEVPEDLAGVALFLASDDARFMTGTATTVDGGYALH